jgi:mono/diheme cytochrome c family protein
MKFSPSVALVATVLSIAALVSLAAFQDSSAPEPTAAGRAAYDDACSRCHGADAQNGRAPSLIPFGWNYAQALDIVRHGSACGMPAFSESELPDRTVEQIVGYLKLLTERIEQETRGFHDSIREVHVGNSGDRCCAVTAVRSCN